MPMDEKVSPYDVLKWVAGRVWENLFEYLRVPSGVADLLILHLVAFMWLSVSYLGMHLA